MIAFVLFEIFFTKRPVSMAARLYYTLVSVSPLLMTIVVDVFATIRLSMSDILS